MTLPLNKWIEWRIKGLYWWEDIISRHIRTEDDMVACFLKKNWKAKTAKVARDDRQSYNKDYVPPKEKQNITWDMTREYRDLIKRIDNIDIV